MCSEGVYWLALHSVSKIGPASYRALLEAFGSAEAVLDAAPENLARIPRISRQMGTEISTLTEQLDRFSMLLERLEANGVSLLRECDEGYPRPLGEILRHPPPVLYASGPWRQTDRRAVAIVGTRTASNEAMAWAYELAAKLAGQGCTVVSGNAEGIDGAAHRGALAVGGRTIMVIPVGINHFRPGSAVRGLDYDRDQLVVISSFYPDQPWKTAAAMARNRIIAALSQAVIVGELGSTSGTLSTARAAAGFHIPVFVLHRPGRPDLERRNSILYRRGAVRLDGVEEAAGVVLERMRSGDASS